MAPGAIEGRQRSCLRGVEEDADNTATIGSIAAAPPGGRDMLSPEVERVIQGAMSVAYQRGHTASSLEHLLLALLDDPGGAATIADCGASVSRVRDKVQDYLGTLPLTEEEAAELLPDVALTNVIERAVALVKLTGHSTASVRSLVVAMFSEPASKAAVILQEEGLNYVDVLAKVSEGTANGDILALRRANTSETPWGQPALEALEKFTVNLNERMRSSKSPPIVGREREVEFILRVLARRRKNSVLLIGEPGVGKRAIVAGLVQRLEAVPLANGMRRTAVLALDLGSLLAGTRFRGDFEERLRSVMHGIATHEADVLFIEDLHALAGVRSGTGGSTEASDLMKPLLASGKVRCIATTTLKDFEAHIQKEQAFTRLFHILDVKEVTTAEAIKVLQRLRPSYERFHGVSYTDKALRAAVTLSTKHLHDRLLPDRAIDLMDEAGARRKVKSALGGRGTRTPTVGVREIEETIRAITNAPARKRIEAERQRIRGLAADLKKKIFGQDHAVDKVTEAIRVNRAGLGVSGHPVGSFLFAGPTGVGKTELAKQLAEAMDLAFLRFDMSEYAEKHSISRLIGAPPGYAGYGEGGLLTNAVLRSPNSVVLLDEVEKAHPDLYNILLQVMDYGSLTDTNGKVADFRNVLLILTTNAGAHDKPRRLSGFGRGSQVESTTKDEAVSQLFSPELRNRLDAKIDFAPLDPRVMGQIVDKFLVDLTAQLTDRRIVFHADEAVRGHLAVKGFDAAHGARPLGRLIQEQLRKPLADEILFGRLTDGGTVTVELRDEALTLICSNEAAAPSA
jgi:ATP-dependent Clp protease ATP-binding subunit ClpA